MQFVPVTRVPLCLDSAVPAPLPGATFGVSSDIVDLALGEHREPICDCVLVPVSRQAWGWLPPASDVSPSQALYFFTDGSFDPALGTAGWAFVLVCLQDGIARRVGCRCGAVPRDDGVPSAYRGEIRALLHAIATAAARDVDTVFVGGDCQAALDVVFGLAQLGAEDPAGRAAQSLLFFAFSRGIQIRPLKAANRGFMPDGAMLTCPSFEACIQEGLVHHLWMAAREMLDLGLHKHACALAGQQEARCQEDGAWCHCDGQALLPDRRSFSICHAEPRILIVLLRLGSCRLACVVAHALTSAKGAADVAAWWLHLQQVCARIPPGHAMLLFVDANAQFRGSPACPDTLQTSPDNPNARHFQALCMHFQLQPTAQYDTEGRALFSWRSPSQDYERLLDYICVPRGWAAGLETCAKTCLGDLRADWDRRPIKARLSADVDVSLPPQRMCLDPAGHRRGRQGPSDLACRALDGRCHNAR
eukprot:s344_g9.t2